MSIQRFDTAGIPGNILFSAVHPQRRHIALGTSAGFVGVFHFFGPFQTNVPQVPKGPVQLLAFTPDGVLVYLREWILATEDWSDPSRQKGGSTVDLRTQGADFGEPTSWAVNRRDIVIGTSTGYLISTSFAPPPIPMDFTKVDGAPIRDLHWWNDHEAIFTTPSVGLRTVRVRNDDE